MMYATSCNHMFFCPGAILVRKGTPEESWFLASKMDEGFGRDEWLRWKQQDYLLFSTYFFRMDEHCF